MRLLESIKQIVFWFPLVWKTRDFDYNYTLEFFLIKLRKLYNFLSSADTCGIQEAEDLQALKRCVEILEILVDNEYKVQIFDEHYRKIFINETQEADNFRKCANIAESFHASLLKEFFELFTKHYRNWWD